MPRRVSSQALPDEDKSFRADLRSKLAALIEQHGGQASVHRQTGISTSTMAKWTREAKPQTPSAIHIRKLCRGLRIDANEFLDLRGEYVPVPFRKVSKTLRGAELLPVFNGTREIHFRADWLEKKDRRLEDIFAFDVDPGMALDRVLGRDVVLIDSTDKRPQEGSLFLVIVGTSIGIKRLESEPKGKLAIWGRSEEPIRVRWVDLAGERIAIAGRVIWRGGEA